MKVLVDTCVWSLALRREQTEQTGIVQELAELISESRAQFIGPIRQELLSGIKEERQFQKLKIVLQAFPDVVLESADFECAANFFSRCRQKGIQGSNTDFLICAVARSRNMSIFTLDNDFTLYQQVIPVILHTSRF